MSRCSPDVARASLYLKSYNAHERSRGLPGGHRAQGRLQGRAYDGITGSARMSGRERRRAGIRSPPRRYSQVSAPRAGEYPIRLEMTLAASMTCAAYSKMSFVCKGTITATLIDAMHFPMKSKIGAAIPSTCSFDSCLFMA